MSAVPFSAVRTLLIAQNTLREAVRQKVFSSLLVLALVFVAGTRWLGDFNFGASELKFIADCGLGALTFFGSVLTITAAAQLFFSEIENRTALTLLAKPVWRTEFVVGKFLGVAGLSVAFCAILAVVLAAVLWWRETELAHELSGGLRPDQTVSYAMIAWAALLHALKFAVLAAFALLVATYAQTQLFTVVTAFVFLVICHLQAFAQEVYLRAGSAAGRAVGGVIAAVFPNFQLFTIADSLAAADAPTWSHVARIAFYAIGYVCVACALAVFSFRRREF